MKLFFKHLIGKVFLQIEINFFSNRKLEKYLNIIYNKYIYKYINVFTKYK